MTRTGRIIAATLLLSLPACTSRDGGGRTAAETPRDSGPAAGEVPADTAGPGSSPTIVFLGTSLTAGYGLDPEQAFPALIQQKLDSAGLDYRVVGAGVSGETSAGALQRIDWILRQQPAVLVLESGANDGLRGQNPDSTRANIQAVIDRIRTRSPRTRILLAAMEAMPNLGAEYTGRFRAIYPELAERNGITLIPFILDGVAGVDSLNQQDGIHPNEAGERIVAGNIWRVLRGALP